MQQPTNMIPPGGDRIPAGVGYMTPDLCEALAAIPAAIEEAGGIAATGKNQHFSYSYLSEADVVGAVRPVLVAHGLSIIPVSSDLRLETLGKNQAGQVRSLSVLSIRWMIVHCGGGWLIAETIGQGADEQDKGGPKAYTSAFRELLRRLGCAASKEDPEADPRTEEPARGNAEGPPFRGGSPTGSSGPSRGGPSRSYSSSPPTQGSPRGSSPTSSGSTYRPPTGSSQGSPTGSRPTGPPPGAGQRTMDAGSPRGAAGPAGTESGTAGRPDPNSLRGLVGQLADILAEVWPPGPLWNSAMKRAGQPFSWSDVQDTLETGHPASGRDPVREKEIAVAIGNMRQALPRLRREWSQDPDGFATPF